MQMTHLLTVCFALALALPGTGCDDEPTAPRPRRGGAGPAPGAASPRPAAAPELVVKPKVAREFRRELTGDDMEPDPTGDVNRDPFRSYLVSLTPTGAATAAPQQDECDDRIVAGKYGYADLVLIGIIARGTRNMAMFRDPAQVGQIASLGDCLSKDKAKITEITPSCVRFEIRGDAPPGAPAPPPRADKRCLNDDEIPVE